MYLSPRKLRTTAQKGNRYCMDRFALIQDLLVTHEADAALLTFMPDIRWCTGFTGSNAMVVCTADEVFFITDGRYTTQSQEEVKGASIHIASRSLVQYMVEKHLGTSSRRILIQADHVTLAEYDAFKEALPGTLWVPVPRLLQQYVAVKNEEEKETYPEGPAGNRCRFYTYLRCDSSRHDRAGACS